MRSERKTPEVAHCVCMISGRCDEEIKKKFGDTIIIVSGVSIPRPDFAGESNAVPSPPLRCILSER